MKKRELKIVRLGNLMTEINILILILFFLIYV